MKKNLLSGLLLGVLTAVGLLQCGAQITPTNFFSDNFTGGSTINSATPAPPGTNFTSYETISSKVWAPTSSVAPHDLQFGIAATTGGTTEIQALFSTNGVDLVAPGTDYIQLTIVFTNTSGGLLTTGQGFLGFGLYNSGSAQNYPVAGGLNGTATTSSATSITGNAADWQGFFAQVAYNGVTSAILTRPPQVGPNNNNQDLLTTASTSESFSHPTGADVGSTITSTLILTNAVYTEVLTIMLNAPGSEAITNSLYAGSSATGTPLTQFGGVATNATLQTEGFNALGMGWYQKVNAHSNMVDVASISVSGYATPVTGPPSITSQPVTTYVVTNGSCAFFASANGFNTTFQWHRNGTNLVDGGNISGSTSDTLIISPATTVDALSGANGYYVTITGAGDFSTNSVTNSLTLITSTNLTWTDALTPDDGWDVNDPVTGVNWQDQNSSPSVFNYGDPVTFNDIGGGGFVNLSNNYLSAASVTVSGGSPYVFQGPGSIAGPGAIDYIGSGRLTFNANDTYSGGTLVSNSTAYVLLQNYAGLGVGSVTLGLVGGKMEIVPAGTASSGIAGAVVVADDFTILADDDGSFGVVFLGDLAGTSGKTLHITPGPSNPNTNTTRIRAYGNATVYNANLDLAANTLFAPYSSAGSQTYNGVISDAGAFMEKGTITYLNGLNTYTGGTYPAQGAIGLGISSVGSPVTSGPIGTGPLFLMPDSTTTLTGSGQILASSGPALIGNAIQYPSGSNTLTLIIGGSANLTLAGPFTLQGNDGVKTNTITSRAIEVTNTALTAISGVISDGGLGYGLNISSNGILALNNTETYSGPTTVSNATLLVNGQIGSGAVTIATNATLGGNGTVTGPVTILNSGTLAPGNQAIGTLTIQNTLALGAASTNKFFVNATANTADKVVANSVTYAGTLVAGVTSGSLSVGNSFTIYSAGSSSGNFSTIAGTPGPGLAWSFNPANGTLSVITGVATNPTNITFTVSSGNLNLSWPADHLGWVLEVQTNTVAHGIGANWVTVPNSGSVDAMSFPINPANGTVFYRLMYP